MSLTNSQYDAIMRQYNQIQFKNKRIQDERIAEVYSKSPRFKEIDELISSSSIACAKKALLGNSSEISSVKETISELSKERKELLASFGYAPDYLLPIYDCPDCKDTGYINNKKCHCFKQATIELLYASSNMEEALKTDNFANFSFEYYPENLVDTASGYTSYQLAHSAVNTAKDFIKNFDNTFDNILIYGNTGVGKTFLSNCIARELVLTSHSVIYFSAHQLFDALAKSTFNHEENVDDTFQHIYDCDLLIIDDLGTELTNSFVSSQLFQCVNERLLRKHSTIISTNLNAQELVNTYSERTFSRISSNYKIVKLFAEDIRHKAKKH